MDEIKTLLEALIESNASIRKTQLEILESQKATEKIVTDLCGSVMEQIPMLGAMFGEGGIGKMFGL